MRVYELARKSSYGRLAPLDPVVVNEGIADSIKTKAKAIGSRVGNAALATFGNNKADGRLTARIMTDRMIAGWKKYMGAANIDQTRENLFKFLNHYYGGHLGDNRLRGIVGLEQSGDDDQGTPTPQDGAPTPKPDDGLVRDERQGEMDFGADDTLNRKVEELMDLLRTPPK